MMKTIKRVKLCLIAVLAVVFVSMSCALVAPNVKRAAAVSLGSGTFVMDDTGLTLRTNNQVGPRFKVKMEKGLADRITTMKRFSPQRKRQPERALPPVYKLQTKPKYTRKAIILGQVS